MLPKSVSFLVFLLFFLSAVSVGWGRRRRQRQGPEVPEAIRIGRRRRSRGNYDTFEFKVKTYYSNPIALLNGNNVVIL